MLGRGTASSRKSSKSSEEIVPKDTSRRRGSYSLEAGDKKRESRRSSFTSSDRVQISADNKSKNASSKKYFRSRSQGRSPGEPNKPNKTLGFLSRSKKDPELTPATLEASTLNGTFRSPGSNSRRSNDEILAEINKMVDNDCDDSGSMQGSMQNFVITTVQTNSDAMSVMTDDFHNRQHHHHHGTEGYSRSSKPLDMVGEYERELSDDGTFPSVQATTALFTFQRRNAGGSEDGTVCETTLNAKTVGVDEESMEDIVKRLQQKGASSGVLKFEKSEIKLIKAGSKEIVFVLVQVNGAKFSKDEFGRMMASEVAGLTQQRPILIEIQTEDVVEGETLDVF